MKKIYNIILTTVVCLAGLAACTHDYPVGEMARIISVAPDARQTAAAGQSFDVAVTADGAWVADTPDWIQACYDTIKAANFVAAAPVEANAATAPTFANGTTGTPLDATQFASRIPLTISGYDGSDAIENLPVLVRLGSISAQGFDVSAVAPERLGIRIMRERAASSGGTLSVVSGSSAGITVFAESTQPESAEEILRESARIVRQDADVIIGLNFWMSPEKAAERGIQLTDGNRLYVDGVLRLVSRSDEEWEKIFAPWYTVERLEHFAWPGETAETRRLFYLRPAGRRADTES